MGQDISCPCHNNDSNVYFPPEEEIQDPDQASVDHIKLPNSPTTVTALNTGSTYQSSNPFDEVGLGRVATTVQTPIAKGKSRKWDAVPKDGNGGGDNSSRSTQQVCAYCPYYCGCVLHRENSATTESQRSAVC